MGKPTPSLTPLSGFALATNWLVVSGKAASLQGGGEGLSKKLIMYPMRYVTSQADLTPSERVVYTYLTKQGFVTLQRIVEATKLTKQEATKALEGLNGQNFILNEQGKVSLSVHAKQVLGFYANK